MSSPKLPPISALTVLEPRPGGQWIVNEQEGDMASLSYIMDNGSEAITYTLHQCRTEEDIRKHCASFVYEYTDDVLQDGSRHQNVHEAATRPRNHPEVASLLYYSQEEAAMPQYSTDQIQQPLQEHILFTTDESIVSSSETQPQASTQFEETAIAPASDLYQHGQRYLLSNGQQLSQGILASGAIEWPLNNELFPTAVGNTPISMANTEMGSAQDTTMILGPWQQNWGHLNPNTGQGSDGNWDAFFSQQ